MSSDPPESFDQTQTRVKTESLRLPPPDGWAVWVCHLWPQSHLNQPFTSHIPTPCGPWLVPSLAPGRRSHPCPGADCGPATPMCSSSQAYGHSCVCTSGCFHTLARSTWPVQIKSSTACPLPTPPPQEDDSGVSKVLKNGTAGLCILKTAMRGT